MNKTTEQLKEQGLCKLSAIVPITTKQKLLEIGKAKFNTNNITQTIINLAKNVKL